MNTDTAGNGITVSGEALFLSGTGVSATGAIRNLAGDNTWTGPVTLEQIAGIPAPPPATPPFTINFGVDAGSLTMGGAIGEAGRSFGIDKVAPGTLVFKQSDTYTGLTTINQGDVQVDGQVGNVALAGGSLSGKGTVGTVDGQPPVGSPAVGTINPGDNGTTNTIGVLHTQPVTLGAGSTLLVDLKHTSVGAPVPGTDNDQLAVTGDVFLNGATLAGLASPSLQIGDSATIIQTTGGTIHGKLAEPFSPNVVFLNRQKVQVQYLDPTDPTNLNGANPTAVVLKRAQTISTVTVTSSTANAAGNTSVYGQPVKFTAQVTLEPGAAPIPTTDVVVFTLDNSVQL